MKTLAIINVRTRSILHRFMWLLLFVVGGSTFLFGQTTDYLEFKGQVSDAKSGKPIAEVHLSVENTHITSLANTNGEFTLKVPVEHKNAVLRFFKINYEPKSMQLAFFNEDFTEVTLMPTSLNTELLDEVELYRASDPRNIVKKALEKRTPSSEKLMAFYREKIDRGRRNVMLGEAVMQIDKGRSVQGKKGEMAIYKSRKITDYKRLDTLAVKLRGGPYTALHLDVVSFPEFLFYPFEILDAYNFSFDDPTTIDNRYIYVIRFEQLDKSKPWYHGTMYIDAKSRSLVKINHSLNVDNRKAAARMLVVKKPKRAKVTPIEVNYQAEYIEKDGQWYFNYGQFFIDLRVNWKGKLFNSRYAVLTEMVITDRSDTSFFPEESLTRIGPNIVMSDDISGFEDPEFWGANNTIHPNKKLQDVLQAIQEKIKAGQ